MRQECVRYSTADMINYILKYKNTLASSCKRHRDIINSRCWDKARLKTGFSKNMTHSFEIRAFFHVRRWWQCTYTPPRNLREGSRSTDSLSFGSKKISPWASSENRRRIAGISLTILITDCLEKLCRWRKTTICLLFAQVYLSLLLGRGRSGVFVCWHQTYLICSPSPTKY